MSDKPKTALEIAIAALERIAAEYLPDRHAGRWANEALADIHRDVTTEGNPYRCAPIEQARVDAARVEALREGELRGLRAALRIARLSVGESPQFEIEALIAKVGGK